MQEKSSVTSIAPFLNSINTASDAQASTQTTDAPPTTLERKLLYFLGKLNSTPIDQLANLANASTNETEVALGTMQSLDLVEPIKLSDGTLTYQLTQSGGMIAPKITL
jgi:hypothetical protein